MGKLTYLLTNDRNLRKAHVLIDGTDVHASHPRGEPRLVTFKTGSDKDALAKFQELIKTHFHPRDGWILAEKKPGVADYPEFPKPPTEEELAAAAAAVRARKLGYAQDGTYMVLDVSRQRTVGDLEIALERAGDTEQLWVITALDDEDGASAHSVFSRLEAAAPKLRTLAVDCPWDTLTRSAGVPLPGLGAFLDKRRTLERLSVTGQAVWSRPLAMPQLTELSLCADPLDPEALARITPKSLPALKTLRLGLAVEDVADQEAIERVPSLPLAQLDTLTVTALPDVAAMMTRLLKSAKALPAHVELDGSVADGEVLLALVKRWQKETQASLALGEEARGDVDEDTDAALEEAIGSAFSSPFAPDAQDPRAQALWKRIA
jgi:hypothetical protein